MNKYIVIIGLALSLGGCSTFTNNYENKNITPKTMHSIATDSSNLLAQKYPAGNTTFSMSKCDKNCGQFATFLIAQLRKKGFAIDTSTENGISLRYLLDTVGKDLYRLGLITPHWRMDMMYQDSNNRVIRLNQTQRIDR